MSLFIILVLAALVGAVIYDICAALVGALTLAALVGALIHITLAALVGALTLAALVGAHTLAALVGALTLAALVGALTHTHMLHASLIHQHTLLDLSRSHCCDPRWDHLRHVTHSVEHTCRRLLINSLCDRLHYLLRAIHGGSKPRKAKEG